MEAGEYGLTRGACFVACRLEVVAVATLLWISWRVLGAAVFFLGGGVRFSFPSNAHGLLQVSYHLASFTSLLAMRLGRGSEATAAVFAFRKPLHTRVRTGCHYLISLSVIVYV